MVFVSALIILGLVCIIISLTTANSFLSSLFSEIAGVFLIGGSTSIIYEMFARGDFVKINEQNTERILDEIRLSAQTESIGLVQVEEDSTKSDYAYLIENSGILIVVLNDGRTWTSMQAEGLRRRFKDPNKKTIFYLLHPESPMLAILARKVGASVTSLQSKILETVTLLNGLRTEKTQLEIYGHYLFNPHSLLVADQDVYVTPYFISRVRRFPPTYVFRKTEDQTGFYAKAVADLEALRLDSEEISQYQI
jgi:hypothetical protein